jgi:glutamate--cysteine ligase
MKVDKLTRSQIRTYIEKKLFEPNTIENINSQNNSFGFMGIELELFPYSKDKNAVNGYITTPLYVGDHALLNSLIPVAKSFGGIASNRKSSKIYKSNNSQIDVIKFLNGDCFLFEPGGQVEISTAPTDSIIKLEERLLLRQKILRTISSQTNIEFGQIGINPLFHVNDIKNQLQKPRYLALENYFNSISTYGKQMMMQTCSMHINFDLGKNEATQVKRIIAANLLVPFATALFANSAVVEGKLTGYKSYRNYIWQHLDSLRTGILPLDSISNATTKNDLIELYLDFTLKAPLIYIEKLSAKTLPINYTLEYWINNGIEDIWPDESSLENHLSLLFPEVRIKGYIELRTIDAPPLEWQMIPICFYAGLLFSDSHLDKTLDLLMPYKQDIASLYKKAIYGLEAEDLFDISKKLMNTAIAGFSSFSEDFRHKTHVNKMNDFYANYTLLRKTFADDNQKKYNL